MHCQTGSVATASCRGTRRHELRCHDIRKSASTCDSANRACPSQHEAVASLHHVKQSGKLDTGMFQHFGPLLEACQDYAELTGCRFQGLSFEAETLEPLQGVLAEGDLILSTSGVASLERLDPLLVAELHAMPAVRDFTQRLQGNDPQLLSDLGQAMHVMMEEGVRNSFRGTCRELGLWPPVPAPPGIPEDDCSYEDVVEELPVIAQRLYNDEAKRRCMLMGKASDGLARVQQASTASFVVDFANIAGVQLPEMPLKYQELLQEFRMRVSEWQQQQDQVSQALQEDWAAADIFVAADMLRSDIKRWLDRSL